MVTFFANTKTKESIDIEISDIIGALKSDKYKEIVLKYRSLINAEEKRLFKANHVPAITISGVFNGKSSSDIVRHSGFIAMDFDSLDDIDTAKAELYADEYTTYGFESISGKGLCIVVKINPDKHLDAFNGLEKYYFEKYGYSVDTATKNINRLRFITYDPQLYHNPKGKLFNKYLTQNKAPKTISVVFSDNDIDHVFRQIRERAIDLTQDYKEWIAIGMAIKDHMGENGLPYFKMVSQFHPKYNERQVERKYASFKGGSVKIGSFLYLAKRAGIEIVSPKTKLISNAALYAKKSRRNPEQVIEQLKKTDGIKREDSEKIVKEVFSKKVDLISDDDEDLIPQIEDFLKREADIRYNEVTLKYELEGKPMTDRDFNTVFINCKTVIPRVSKDLVISCIDSDRTPIYNPIKEFFLSHAGQKKKGLIEQLSECITSRTGSGMDSDYCYYFLRKWMVGAVAMWHGENSPLMLVLAGSKQNTGKSHFFRHLLPKELMQYYAEAELTGDKDENLLMCSKIIIMNDEMSNKSNRDITVMKKLCSTQWFNLRRPYGKLSEDFRRIAALCGTSNNLELLSDPTGNRRIIPIEVLSIDHGAYNDIDKIELWMEAYHAWQAGESYTMSNEDISRLAESAVDFEESSPEAELVMKYFEVPTDSTDIRITEMTNTEIKVICEFQSRQKLSQKKLGMELKRLGFMKVIKKVSGVAKQVYYVIERLDSLTLTGKGADFQ
jgi:hypothetical protein